MSFLFASYDHDVLLLETVIKAVLPGYKEGLSALTLECDSVSVRYGILREAQDFVNEIVEGLER